MSSIYCSPLGPCAKGECACGRRAPRAPSWFRHVPTWRAAVAEAADRYDAAAYMPGAPLVGHVFPRRVTVIAVPRHTMPPELRNLVAKLEETNATTRVFLLVRRGEVVDCGFTQHLPAAGAA
jgi:hypothetical protein